MPLKRKTKISPGQLTLFGEAAVDSASEQPTAVSKKRGDVTSWRKFATEAYRSKYPWLDVHLDGIYTAISVSTIQLEVPHGVAVACLSPSLSLGHGQML